MSFLGLEINGSYSFSIGVKIFFLTTSFYYYLPSRKRLYNQKELQIREFLIVKNIETQIRFHIGASFKSLFTDSLSIRLNKCLRFLLKFNAQDNFANLFI